MLETVIFDVDGTLVDTVDLHAASWAQTFRQFGHPMRVEAVRAQIGKGGDQLMPALLPAEVVRREGEAMETYRRELFQRDMLPRARAFPKVPELFGRIREDGRRIVLASSGNPEEIAYFRRLAGIDGLVDATVTAADAERSKPCPDIFVAALGGTDAAAALVVGDTPYDAEAAARAGIPAIGLLSGGFAPVALHAAGCIALYKDPAELLARYESSPLARH